MKMLKIKLIHKTIKQTQTIRRLMQKNWLNVLNHSVESILKGWKPKIFWYLCKTYLKNTSVIRLKGKSQNGCLKKRKQVKLSENEHFSTPDTHTYVFIFMQMQFTTNTYNTILINSNF